MGSWLDARSAGGKWLLRHEDLDTARIVPGAERDIEDCLARLGLVPDEPPIRQSSRLAAYEAAYQRLRSRGLLYPCRCSRSEAGPGPYPGTCRDAAVDPRGDVAWRLRMPEGIITFADRLQGAQQFPSALLGDPVVRRRDDVFAYQFAVVVDDAWQGITDVVRGADLLDSTGWQVAIAQALELSIPRFLHLPVLVEADGSKLAKSRRSFAIGTIDPAKALRRTLQLLCPGHEPPDDADPRSLLSWGLCTFDTARLEAGRTTIVPKDYLGS